VKIEKQPLKGDEYFMRQSDLAIDYTCGNKCLYFYMHQLHRPLS